MKISTGVAAILLGTTAIAHAEISDGVVRIDNADFLSRPVRLGSSEATALIVAVRALREGSPAASRDAVDRVLAKLEEATTVGATAAARPTTSSSSIVRMVATAAAHASGWPEYVRPPG